MLHHLRGARLKRPGGDEQVEVRHTAIGVQFMVQASNADPERISQRLFAAKDFVRGLEPIIRDISIGSHMSTRQYARLVHEWVAGIGLQPQAYGTHELRRTKASIIYKATGNLRAVQILLGHAKIESTVRYLGVDVEDALKLAERTEV